MNLKNGEDITVSDSGVNSFDTKKLIGLPANSYFAVDNQMNVFKNSVNLIQKPGASLPFILMSDKNGNIIFTSSGYRIGIGEQIIKLLQFM
jgi:hypothetical protein